MRPGGRKRQGLRNAMNRKIYSIFKGKKDGLKEGKAHNPTRQGGDLQFNRNEKGWWVRVRE